MPVAQETSAAASPGAEGMLSATERARAGELVRTADRELYPLAHVAQRELLGRCTGVPPGELDLPPEGSIQGGPRHGRPDGQRAIAAHPPSRRRRAFLRCWVRKAADLKGRGIGLSEELSLSNVSVGADGQPSELLSGWRLVTVAAAQPHLTAVAALLPPDHPGPRMQTRTHPVQETPRRQQASGAAVSTVRCSDEAPATGSGAFQGAPSSSMRSTASQGVRTCDAAQPRRSSRERPDSPRARDISARSRTTTTAARSTSPLCTFAVHDVTLRDVQRRPAASQRRGRHGSTVCPSVGRGLLG